MINILVLADSFYLYRINSVYIPQTVFDENSCTYLTFHTVNVYCPWFLSSHTKESCSVGFLTLWRKWNQFLYCGGFKKLWQWVQSDVIALSRLVLLFNGHTASWATHTNVRITVLVITQHIIMGKREGLSCVFHCFSIREYEKFHKMDSKNGRMVKDCEVWSSYGSDCEEPIFWGVTPSR
jgi:hypothetical protein